MEDRPKKRINIKQIVADMASGQTRHDIVRTHGLTEKSLEKLLLKLLKVGAVTKFQLHQSFLEDSSEDEDGRLDIYAPIESAGGDSRTSGATERVAMRIDALFEEAEAAERAADWKRAITAYEDILRLSPDYEEVEQLKNIAIQRLSAPASGSPGDFPASETAHRLPVAPEQMLKIWKSAVSEALPSTESLVESLGRELNQRMPSLDDIEQAMNARIEAGVANALPGAGEIRLQLAEAIQERLPDAAGLQEAMKAAVGEWLDARSETLEDVLRAVLTEEGAGAGPHQERTAGGDALPISSGDLLHAWEEHLAALLPSDEAIIARLDEHIRTKTPAFDRLEERLEQSLEEHLRQLDLEKRVDEKLASVLGQMPSLHNHARRFEEALRAIPSEQDVSDLMDNALEAASSLQSLNLRMSNVLTALPSGDDILFRIDRALRQIPSKEEILEHFPRPDREVPPAPVTKTPEAKPSRVMAHSGEEDTLLFAPHEAGLPEDEDGLAAMEPTIELGPKELESLEDVPVQSDQSVELPPWPEPSDVDPEHRRQAAESDTTRFEDPREARVGRVPPLSGQGADPSRPGEAHEGIQNADIHPDNPDIDRLLDLQDPTQILTADDLQLQDATLDSDALLAHGARDSVGSGVDEEMEIGHSDLEYLEPLHAAEQAEEVDDTGLDELDEDSGDEEPADTAEFGTLPNVGQELSHDEVMELTRAEERASALADAGIDQAGTGLQEHEDDQQEDDGADEHDGTDTAELEPDDDDDEDELREELTTEEFFGQEIPTAELPTGVIPAESLEDEALDEELSFHDLDGDASSQVSDMNDSLDELGPLSGADEAVMEKEKPE